MNPGRMDRKIIIEEITATTINAVGEPIPTWGTFATVWAEKMPLRGRERFEAQQVNAEADDKWRIRYLAGVVAKMRISYDSKLFDIQSVQEVGRRNGMELMTTVGANA